MAWGFPSKEERRQYQAAGRRSDDLRVARKVIAQIGREVDAANRRGDTRAANRARAEIARIKVANYIG